MSEKDPRRIAAKRQRFIAELADGNTVTGAAQAADVARSTAYDWRNDDPDFRQAWDSAWDQGADLLEAEALRRAVHGVDKPVTVAGEREIVREYSDTLLIFLLKGRRPERYRDNHRVEHTGADGGPMEVTNPDVAAAIERFTASVVQLAARPGAGTAAGELTAGGES